ncbi:MAG TPA: hypothetical protein VMV12_03825 [Candidatus Micrarchaeaceae archaeon]|nr:hypothetical protein [Candidatus Micrarchaeaceae archaeon]
MVRRALMVGLFFQKKWAEREREPPPPASDRLNVYLGADYRETEFKDGAQVVMDGSVPFLDVGCTQRRTWADEEPTTDRVFHCHRLGGRYEQADLQRPQFEVGAQFFGYPEPTNRCDPNALRVCLPVEKSSTRPVIFPGSWRGRWPPLIRVSGAGKGTIVETETSDGIRTGLRLVRSVGREMFVESVPTTKR